MTRTSREGFALPVTVLALVVAAGLIAGGVFLAAQETQIAVSARHSTEAFLAAERGLAYAIGNTSRKTYEKIGEGNELELDLDPEYSGGVETQSEVRIRSLGNDLYFVESTGRVTGGGTYAGAAHRTGTLVRPLNATFNIDSALKTLGGVVVTGAGFVSGQDREPDDWETCEEELVDPKPGIISSGVSMTDGSGQVEGDPQFEQDETLSAEDFLQFGPIHYDQLAGAADYTLDGGNLQPSPSTVDGECNVDDTNNFGAPDGPCQDHFPVIHVEGNATLQGYGQGIMLVDGNFVARGGGRFNGIVIVKGMLLNGGGNGGVTGGILVYNNGLETSYTINGNGVALYSSCAVQRAEENANALNRIYPIAERSWVNLSGTGSLTY